MNDPFWLPPALEMALNEPALREYAAMSEAQKQAAAEFARLASAERETAPRFRWNEL